MTSARAKSTSPCVWTTTPPRAKSTRNGLRLLCKREDGRLLPSRTRTATGSRYCRRRKPRFLKPGLSVAYKLACYNNDKYEDKTAHIVQAIALGF